MKFSLGITASIAAAISFGSIAAEAASCSSVYGQCGGKLDTTIPFYYTYTNFLL